MNDIIRFKNNFIDFEIARALSVYNNKSASGKTYLPYYVSRFRDFPSMYVFRTEQNYNDFIDNPWHAGESSIYFFDRFDMFGSDKLISILTSRSDICSLLDYKDLRLFRDLDVKPRGVIITRKSTNMIEVKNGFLL